MLDSHPDIISAEETETFHDYAYIPLLPGSLANAYLPLPLQSATPPLLRQSRDNYFNAMEQMFGEPIGHRLLIDKNPSLTFMLPALCAGVSGGEVSHGRCEIHGTWS